MDLELLYKRLLLYILATSELVKHSHSVSKGLGPFCKILTVFTLFFVRVLKMVYIYNAVGEEPM